MMIGARTFWILGMLAATQAVGAGDPQRGAAAFGACAACHSLEPGRNLTGPSLSGLWGRKAGSLESFVRYSPVLIKTDTSASGPAPGRPVMVGQGMGGDRAQVVFSSPADVSRFIKEGC